MAAKAGWNARSPLRRPRRLIAVKNLLLRHRLEQRLADPTGKGLALFGGGFPQQVDFIGLQSQGDRFPFQIRFFHRGSAQSFSHGLF